MLTDNGPIGRKQTALRILLSLLFVVIVETVIKAVLLLVIVFDLAYTLITRQAPSERMRTFANRTVSYTYRILRYLTYNEAEPPFPFVDFPPELEPPAQLNQGRQGGPERL